MGPPRFGIGRTTIVCLAMVVLCLTVAAKTWQSAPGVRTTEAQATVERITLTQQGQQADVPLVTASFVHEGSRQEIQFASRRESMAVGDQFGLFYEPGQPSKALPAWAVEAEQGNQRFLAVCLGLAALIAVALAAADHRSRLGRPTSVSYHGRTLAS